MTEHLRDCPFQLRGATCTCLPTERAKLQAAAFQALADSRLAERYPWDQVADHCEVDDD